MALVLKLAALYTESSSLMNSSADMKLVTFRVIRVTRHTNARIISPRLKKSLIVRCTARQIIGRGVYHSPKGRIHDQIKNRGTHGPSKK
jgi:hypothetical protein